MKFTEGNRYVKELRMYLKDNFCKLPKDLHVNLLKEAEQIIINNEVELKNILPEDKIENFKKYNNIRVIDTKFKQIYSDSIIKILKKIEEEESKVQILSTETRANTYRNVIIENGDIFPDEDFDIKSLKLNLFYNNKIEFSFNDKIKLQKLDKTSSFIQTLQLEINGSGDQVVIPTKYEAICTARLTGVECSNIVNFCDIHKNSSITCSDTPSRRNPGHIIKKLDDVPVKESIVLYSYDGKDALNESSGDLRIFSLVEITKEKVTCNAVHVIENKEEYIMILNIKEEEISALPFDQKILLKSDKSRHFLDDIYNSLHKYLLKEHNVVVTNQNKIVGEIIIFVLLNKLFYDIKMNAMIIGSSGAGKSFWSQYIIPMLTFNYKVISGSDVTRNRFLGGRSNMVSAFKNSAFQIGFVGTQDLIFCEESTEPLNKFFEPNVDKNSNIFSMLKIASANYDVGIQGSKSVTPKASCVLIGNLEQLSHIQKYKEMVAKKYRNYSAGKKYKNHWPLFKPLEYYEDPDLAKAHLHIRKNEWMGHYVTKLPSAEQARFNFLLILEDEEVGFKKPALAKETQFKKYHRTEFINELSQLFNQKIPDKLREEIYEYFCNDFLKQRNNIMKNGYMKLNNHVFNKQLEIITQFTFMNKLYYNEEMKLNEMDKSLICDFMLYNYNCINSDEAALIKKPFVNDYLSIINEDDLTEFDFQKKEDYVNKLKEEQQQMSDMIEGDDLLK